MIYEHERREYTHKADSVVCRRPECSRASWDWDKMDDYLNDRGLSSSLARLNGWYPCTEKGTRVCIPAISRVPGHHFWQARAIYDGQEPRYHSPFGPRRDALIGVYAESMFVRENTMCICEGPMDALALAEIDGVYAYATMGANPTDEQVQHLALLAASLNPKDVFQISDKDNLNGSLEFQSRLMMVGVNTLVRIPDRHKDVAGMSLAERKALLL